MRFSDELAAAIWLMMSELFSCYGMSCSDASINKDDKVLSNKLVHSSFFTIRIRLLSERGNNSPWTIYEAVCLTPLIGPVHQLSPVLFV